jgi:hypothetical protein
VLCAPTMLMFDSETTSPSTNFSFQINRLETFQTAGIQMHRQRIDRWGRVRLAAR